MDLKELLGEELYNQVVAKAGDKKLAVVSDGNWFPKEKFDQVNNAKKEAEKNLQDRDTQLEQLKASAGDNEALKAQIADLQTTNATAKTEYETKLKELQLTTAIKLALGNDVHDADMALGQLDKSVITLDENGAIKSGLKEQIETLRTSKSFLFVPKTEETTTRTFTGVTPGQAGGGAGKPPGSGTGYDVGKALAEARNQQKQGSVTK